MPVSRPSARPMTGWSIDIDAELAALGPTGYRPLRVRDTLL
nr:hypothetical protein [Nocardia otitidiscaviarum]